MGGLNFNCRDRAVHADFHSTRFTTVNKKPYYCRFWSQGNSIYIYDGESSVNCNAYMYMQVKLDPEVSTGQNKD